MKVRPLGFDLHTDRLKAVCREVVDMAGAGEGIKDVRTGRNPLAASRMGFENLAGCLMPTGWRVTTPPRSSGALPIPLESYSGCDHR